MLVPSGRLIVPLGGLHPKKAAPLTDAALTPYHAIKRALPLLHSDSTVVIFGLGGLGHMAVQLMRVLSPVRIIAGDLDQSRLEQARSLGADETVNTRDAHAAAEQILKTTGPRGAGLVLDCIGACCNRSLRRFETPQPLVKSHFDSVYSKRSSLWGMCQAVPLLPPDVTQAFSSRRNS